MDRRKFLEGMGVALVAVATVDLRAVAAQTVRGQALARALQDLPSAGWPQGVVARALPPVVLSPHLARVTPGMRQPILELGPLLFVAGAACTVRGIGVYDKRGRLLIDPPAFGTLHLWAGDTLSVQYRISGPGAPWLLGES